MLNEIIKSFTECLVPPAKDIKFIHSISDGYVYIKTILPTPTVVVGSSYLFNSNIIFREPVSNIEHAFNTQTNEEFSNYLLSRLKIC